ncbi:thioredoxin-disulfide reductase [Shinella sp.]|uniref:thioredoxin-disulfide reductase n=1 Tax=Shinella sp. TaxID=1870904 RepID=UPI003F6E7119
MTHSRLVILGSGPAGYTAAIYAARANLAPLIVSGSEEGGQLMMTTEVDNWPGDAHGLLGPDLMQRMKEHAMRFGSTLAQDHIISVDLSSRPFRLEGEIGRYTADALIIATGATAKYLGLPSETSYRGKGVSACATCDGFFYRGRDVAIIGGGNTAVEEVLYMANIARKITLVHRRDTLRGEKVLHDRLQKLVASGRVDICWNSTVVEIFGNGKSMQGLRLLNSISGKVSRLDVQGVFIAVGHEPNTLLFRGQIEMENGYVSVRRGPMPTATSTSVAGVFAAGDVMDHTYRQAITSAGSGCMAALDAQVFLEADAPEHDDAIMPAGEAESSAAMDLRVN